MFGLIITTKKKQAEQERKTKYERRQAFEIGRGVGYAEALNERILFVLKEPSAKEVADQNLREAGF